MRSQSWLKAKNTNEQEFVIGGYSEGEGARRKTFGGILVGYYAGDDLRFVASVGSGFTDRRSTRSRRGCTKLRTDRSPFANPPTVDRRPLVRRQVGALHLGEAGARRAGPLQLSGRATTTCAHPSSRDCATTSSRAASRASPTRRRPST